MILGLRAFVEYLNPCYLHWYTQRSPTRCQTEIVLTIIIIHMKGCLILYLIISATAILFTYRWVDFLSQWFFSPTPHSPPQLCFLWQGRRNRVQTQEDKNVRIVLWSRVLGSGSRSHELNEFFLLQPPNSPLQLVCLMLLHRLFFSIRNVNFRQSVVMPE